MGNVLLLLFSSLLLLLVLFYLKQRWPNLDLIDIFLIFVALYFGVYTFIRGLYFGKGNVFNSFCNNPWAVCLVYIQILLIISAIRIVSLYFTKNIKDYLKIKTLVKQWSIIDKSVVILLITLLILFNFVSYFKYGVKSHILPDDFTKIGKDLPYWLMSVRTIYNYLTLCVVMVLAAKASLSKGRTRFFWLASIILFLPLAAYMGRKGFVNAVVMTGLIWLLINEERLFHLKTFTIAAMLIVGFFMASNLYQTYRPVLQSVRVSLSQLENPLTAALNFKATLANLTQRAGTWEFNYLVFDKQMRAPENSGTKGKFTLESIKSAIPRIFWPGKKFQIPTDILTDTFHTKPDDPNSPGTNIFGIAQSDFGYFSLIIVPLTILLIMIIMAALLKITFNYPIILWLLSANIIYFLINIEENGPELFYMLRNTIGLMAVFSLVLLFDRLFKSQKAIKFYN